MMFTFTDAEQIGIQEAIHDYQPRTKGEWCQAVHVGRSIGQLVDREVDARALVREVRLRRGAYRY